MSYYRHHAIIVTGQNQAMVKEARAEIFQAINAHPELQDIDGPAVVTPLVTAGLNGVYSFAVLPDGSKEGRTESDVYDKIRRQFILWLKRQQYADGSYPFEWAEVSFGGD